MRRRPIALAVSCLCVSLNSQPSIAAEAAPVQVEERSTDTINTSDRHSTKPVDDLERTAYADVPAYVPPSRGANKVRIGAATRGAQRIDHVLPRLQAIAPDHIGLTQMSQPNLYWRLDAPSPVPVRITLTAVTVAEPLLELSLEPPVAAGWHKVSLTEHAIRLKTDLVYRWYVAMVPRPERRAADVVVMGAVQVADLDIDTTLNDAIDQLAQQGVWYDLIALVQDDIRDSDGTQRAELLQLRRALLQQIDLFEHE